MNSAVQLMLRRGMTTSLLANATPPSKLMFQNILDGVFSGKSPINISIRSVHQELNLPKIGGGRQFKYIVLYPLKYTTKPIPIRKLGGRDPITGRKVVQGWGGGKKLSYFWIDNKRIGPKEGPPLVERVLKIDKCDCHTPFLALVGHGDQMRWIIATINMKVGDLVKTSREIPRIPVQPNEGDAHPLGAFPIGSEVHNIETVPGQGGVFVVNAGGRGTIVKKVGDRVIVRLESKDEFSFSKYCMAVSGRISNENHCNIPIGSPNKLRELGYAPRSGLWHRKDGRFGRKLKKPKLFLVDEERRHVKEEFFHMNYNWWDVMQPPQTRHW